MKLYYSPGACSLSPHIVLRELGVAFELERVDGKTKTTERGADFWRVNPKGYVPALELADGDVLTEGAAIVQYLADTNDAIALAPRAGTKARARLQEQLNFIASELHQGFLPLFRPGSTDEAKEAARATVTRRFDNVEAMLADDGAYLVTDAPTVADIYLFVMVRWGLHVGLDFGRWPKTAALHSRIAARPAVQAALAAEGLS